MSEAERFQNLQPSKIAPTLWGSDEDERDASSISTQFTPRLSTIRDEELPRVLAGVPSYAKDTQSSKRKKPRRSRRIIGEGAFSDDEGEEEVGMYPGGGGMKGKSCYLVSMRLRTLPIALPAAQAQVNSFGIDWTETITRSGSAASMQFGGGRDGGEKLPIQLSVSACSRLEYLYLRGNLLRSLWDTRYTPAVIVLDVSENELETLFGIENLERLQHLYVNSNALSCIEEVPTLPNLTVLSLSCNRIRSLNHMQRQPSLELLALADNQIHNMAGLGTCPRLLSVRLAGNPISKCSGYRVAILLSAAACGMLELAKVDGCPFTEHELAQAACLAWLPRLSALCGWVPGTQHGLCVTLCESVNKAICQMKVSKDVFLVFFRLT